MDMHSIFCIKTSRITVTQNRPMVNYRNTSPILPIYSYIQPIPLTKIDEIFPNLLVSIQGDGFDYYPGGYSSFGGIYTPM